MMHLLDDLPGVFFMRPTTCFWALTILVIGLAAPARAGVVISIGSASVAQGGTATVDVLITGTAADLINQYGFQLQVSNNGVDNTQLAFSGTQDNSYASNSTLNPSYLFFGDSTAVTTSSGPLTSPTTSATGYPNDTITGTDSTASGNPISISAGQTFLLATVTLTTVTPAAPMLGDSFTISLIPASGDGSVNTNPNTFFDNFSFDTGIETSASPFSSTPGTITVMGAAVPEPASIIPGLTATMILAGAYGVRRSRRSGHR
jgi:hypothetical protein